jgi:hypothetical protein
MQNQSCHVLTIERNMGDMPFRIANSAGALALERKPYGTAYIKKLSRTGNQGKTGILRRYPGSVRHRWTLEES